MRPLLPTRFPHAWLLRALLLAALAGIGPGARAGEGVLEINQTCAVGPGCFPGDGPGLPVTITGRGSYRLTSDLRFNSVLGPPSANCVEISGDDVDLDLNGFAITCSNVLTGAACGGSSAIGILVDGAAARARIRNGAIFGVPGHGIRAINSIGLEVVDVRITETGAFGINGSIRSRVHGCTVTDTGNGGILAGVASVVTDNVVQGAGGGGIQAGEGSVVRGNVARNNAEFGFQVNGDSLVEGNTSSLNQVGFQLSDSASAGGLPRGNTATRNTGLGFSLGSQWLFTGNVAQANNRGSLAPQTAGGIEGPGNACGATLGCP